MSPAERLGSGPTIGSKYRSCRSRPGSRNGSSEPRSKRSRLASAADDRSPANAALHQPATWNQPSRVRGGRLVSRERISTGPSRACSIRTSAAYRLGRGAVAKARVELAPPSRVNGATLRCVWRRACVVGAVRIGSITNVAQLIEGRDNTLTTSRSSTCVQIVQITGQNRSKWTHRTWRTLFVQG
jgi:hypothetical protein